MRKTTSGFTIVELLIVIVVIAVLAAISTTIYSGIQEKAKNVDRKTTANQFVNKLHTKSVDAGKLTPPTSIQSYTDAQALQTELLEYYDVSPLSPKLVFYNNETSPGGDSDFWFGTNEKEAKSLVHVDIVNVQVNPITARNAVVITYWDSEKQKYQITSYHDDGRIQASEVGVGSAPCYRCI